MKVDPMAFEGPKFDEAEVELMEKSWPEHFGCLFDMGLCAFERMFEKRPDLMELFNFADKSNWKKEEKLKKVVLALEQMLVHAVSVFGEEKGPRESNEAVCGFSDLMKELGGLHRRIVPALTPADFDTFFDMLPQVIIDVTNMKRKSGPLDAADTQQLTNTWISVCKFMATQVRLGWEDSVIPKTPKFNKAYRSDIQKQDRRRYSDSKHIEHHKDEEHSPRSSSCTRVSRICSSSNSAHSDRQEEVLIGDVDIVLFSFLYPDVNE